MNRIQNITSVPFQKQTLVLEDGDTFSITLKYVELEQGWFITEILWNTFRLQGIRVTNSPNILYQWRKLIPFGIACFTEGNREPTLQEDFSSGASKLYVLPASDVFNYTEFLNYG